MEKQQFNILYTCTGKQQFRQELFWQEHSLSMLLSGKSHNSHNGKTSIAKAGTIGLIRKNQIFKSLKKPSPDGSSYKAICIRLDQKKLKKYSVENEIYSTDPPYTGKQWIDLKKNVFLKGFF